MNCIIAVYKVWHGRYRKGQEQFSSVHNMTIYDQRGKQSEQVHMCSIQMPLTLVAVNKISRVKSAFL